MSGSHSRDESDTSGGRSWSRVRRRMTPRRTNNGPTSTAAPAQHCIPRAVWAHDHDDAWRVASVAATGISSARRRRMLVLDPRSSACRTRWIPRPVSRHVRQTEQLVPVAAADADRLRPLLRGGIMPFEKMRIRARRLPCTRVTSRMGSRHLRTSIRPVGVSGPGPQSRQWGTTGLPGARRACPQVREQGAGCCDTAGLNSRDVSSRGARLRSARSARAPGLSAVDEQSG